MQFLIIGLDGTDVEAPARRQEARQAHRATGDRLLATGNLWYGAALRDADGMVNGSMYLVDFPARSDVQHWLDEEPYVTGQVWEKVEVRPCSVREPWQFNRPRSFYQHQEEQHD